MQEPATPPRSATARNAPPPVVRRRLPFPPRRGAMSYLEHPVIPNILAPPVLGINSNNEERNNAMNFPNNNPANIPLLNVAENAVNSIMMEPLETGNILYRTAGPANSMNSSHYVKIRNASGAPTNMRKHMRNTRRNPHTRETLNVRNRSRLRRVRKAAAATLKRRRNGANNGAATPAKRSRNNE
jgi:hypothetical protein